MAKEKEKQLKPLEVNEEDVARQVKETLARLTSKGQNKKGAKYRRENAMPFMSGIRKNLLKNRLKAEF